MANARNARAAPASDFAATNPWLEDGEERVEVDTRKTKIGPGYWNDLAYTEGGTPSGASGPGASVTEGAGFFSTLISIPAAEFRYLGWVAFDAGQTVLDLTVPAVPTVLVDGIYAVSVQAAGGLDDGQYALVELDMGILSTGDSWELAPPEGSIYGTAAGTIYLPAGTAIQIGVSHDSPSAQSLGWTAYVQLVVAGTPA